MSDTISISSEVSNIKVSAAPDFYCDSSPLKEMRVSTPSSEKASIAKKQFTPPLDFSSLSSEEIFGGNLDKAQRGDVSAMFRVAQMYENGVGVKEDPSKALSWYNKAGSYAPALYKAALLYKNRIEGDQGSKEENIRKYWEKCYKAMDLGLIDAAFDLAKELEKGTILERNQSGAFNCYATVLNCLTSPKALQRDDTRDIVLESAFIVSRMILEDHHTEAQKKFSLELLTNLCERSYNPALHYVSDHPELLKVEEKEKSDNE